MTTEARYTALKRSYVTVAVEDGPTYQLRDDVPMTVMADYIDIQTTVAQYAELEATLQQAAKGGKEAVIAAAQEMKAAVLQMDEDVLQMCVGIWQHTYPDRAEEGLAEEIAQAFSFEDRRAICELFFLRRFARSSPPSNATTAVDATTTAPASTRQPTRSSRNRSRK